MKLSATVVLAAVTAIGASLCLPESCRAGEAGKGAISVKEPTCEYATNPLAIDTPAPRFGWILDSNRRGQMQTAYRILVANGREKLTPEAADKWDSGKVASGESTHITYEGEPLSSAEACWWTVQVWDKDGRPSAWSEPATFEMGLLQESDWRGQWIGAGGGVKYAERSPVGKGLPRTLALDLAGAKSVVRLRHHALFKPSTGMTISAWIKPTRFTPAWQCIIRKEDGSTGRWLLSMGETKSVRGLHCGLVVNGEYLEKSAAVDPSTLADGNWHLAAATFDGAHIRIYFDDKQAGNWPAAGSLSTAGTGDIYIGSYGGQEEFFDGAIDDVRVYGRALSDEEIANLHANRAVPDTALAGRWEFEGNLQDGSGHGNHARTDIAPAGFAPLLRKEFVIDKPVARARAYTSGLGWCELYINGQKVSDRVLDPATTDYDKRTFYVTHNVTGVLKPGRNAVGVMLGNGWFCPAYCPSCRLRFQMHVWFTDGTVMVVESDENWKVAEGPIGANSIIAGEVYDARKEKPGWDRAGYDDSGWAPAAIQQSPGGVMMSQMLPSIKVNENLPAVSVRQAAPGMYVCDFGRLYAGWARFRFRGEAGRQVTIKYAPLLQDDGSLKEIPGGRSRDVYVLKGDPKSEVYEPRFAFHPVRYVQIENCPGKLTQQDIVGRMAYNAVDMTGGFECSNELLNRIHASVRQTLKNELYGIQMDCMNTEHWGWLEPGSTPGTLYPRIYMPHFWQKYLDDARFAQHPDGVIPEVIPNYPPKNRHTGDPAWTGNYPIAVWYIYQYYGDKRILETHYAAMKRWLDSLTAKAKGHILEYGYYGDHMLAGPAPGKEEWMSPETPQPLIKTAFYYCNARLVSQVAAILGYTGDAAQYSELARNINRAFHETWFNPETSQYAAGSQTANLLPLVFGMTPQAKEKDVANNIVDNILKKYNGHHHTGNIGTTALMEALTRHGYGDVMYEMVNRVDYPGWGYMVDQGSTTIWESWGAYSTNDDRLSMAMFTTIDHFFYNDLAGIKGPAYFSPEAVAPGFREIVIRPFVPKGLTYAKASHNTVRGMVSSEWHDGEEEFTLQVRIPVNSIAEVWMPKGPNASSITEGNVQLWEKGRVPGGVEGMSAATETDDHVVFKVGSGSYHFRARKTR